MHSMQPVGVGSVGTSRVHSLQHGCTCWQRLQNNTVYRACCSSLATCRVVLHSLNPLYKFNWRSSIAWLRCQRCSLGSSVSALTFLPVKLLFAAYLCLGPVNKQVVATDSSSQCLLSSALSVCSSFGLQVWFSWNSTLLCQ